MSRPKSVRIEEHFQDLIDPRRRAVTDPLVNIVVTALGGVLSADDFVSIARWAELKQDWLPRFLDLRAGGPSHDRFHAILAAIAAQIAAQGADYGLAAKDHQPKLLDEIHEYFSEQLEDDCRSVPYRRFESHEKGHGREDDRFYCLAKLPTEFSQAAKRSAWRRAAWRSPRDADQQTTLRRLER